MRIFLIEIISLFVVKMKIYFFWDQHWNMGAYNFSSCGTQKLLARAIIWAPSEIEQTKTRTNNWNTK